FCASFPQHCNRFIQVIGPETNVRKSYRALRGGRRHFQECVTIDLKGGERWLAFFVLDRERFAKAHGFRVEVYGLIEILCVDSEVVQSEPRLLFLGRGAGLRRKNPEYSS